MQSAQHIENRAFESLGLVNVELVGERSSCGEVSQTKKVHKIRHGTVNRGQRNHYMLILDIMLCHIQQDISQMIRHRDCG